jgi:hypothetical protein
MLFTAAAPSWQQHPSILNATTPPFSLDASGATDVTQQLQAAISAAYAGGAVPTDFAASPQIKMG